MERDHDWHGNASELADKAAKILSTVASAEKLEAPNERLVRDYVQRGIVLPPEREGKEAKYHRRHLLQFICARIYRGEGDRWPLARIAEYVPKMTDDELSNEIRVRISGNSAVAVVQPTISETDPGSSPPKSNNRARVANFNVHAAHASSAPPSTPNFHQRAASGSRMQADLRNTLKRLGVSEDLPPAEQVTLIAIATWCQLLIETDRLSRITTADAEEIGRVVTARLLDPKIRKGIR